MLRCIHRRRRFRGKAALAFAPAEKQVVLLQLHDAGYQSIDPERHQDRDCNQHIEQCEQLEATFGGSADEI